MDDAGPRQTLEYLVLSLVDSTDDVRIQETRTGEGIVLEVTVAPDDMGKVIGRAGRTARAIRTVVRAAGTRAGIPTQVQIVG